MKYINKFKNSIIKYCLRYYYLWKTWQESYFSQSIFATFKLSCSKV